MAYFPLEIWLAISSWLEYKDKVSLALSCSTLMNMLMSHFKEEYFSMRTGITNREHMKEVKNIPWKLMDKRILEAHPGYKEGTTSRGGPVCCLPVGFSNDSSLEERKTLK